MDRQQSSKSFQQINQVTTQRDENIDNEVIQKPAPSSARPRIRSYLLAIFIIGVIILVIFIYASKPQNQNQNQLENQKQSQSQNQKQNQPQNQPQIQKQPQSQPQTNPKPTPTQPQTQTNPKPIVNPTPTPKPTPKPIPANPEACFLGAENNFRQDLKLKLSERQLLVNTRYPPVKVVVDTYDRIVSRHITDIGSWEPVNLKTFQRFVKEGDNILNIGSHIGLEAIVLAKKAGPKGTLTIFEPYHVSRKMLKKNICLNDLYQRTTIYGIAASNKKGKGQMQIYYENTGGSQVSEGKAKKRANEVVDIQIDTVDNLVPKDLKVDFALIDVERSEIKTLEGMKGLISRSPNLITVIQWSGFDSNMNKQEYKVKRDAILTWLVSKNFKFYKIDRKVLGFHATPLNCDPEHFSELSIQGVRKVGQRMVQVNTIVDILIVPSHIDPNKL